MFWKYLFPLFLCFFLAWFMRKFLCIKECGISKDESRIPRLWMFLLMASGFIPIANYVIFILVLISLALFARESVYFRKKPFKNEKFQNWLMEN